METKINVHERDGVITVNQWDEPLDIYSNHIRMVMDTREQMIREKLIALGWTPPAQKETPDLAGRG